jgi:preprotein translocase subunit SecB
MDLQLQGRAGEDTVFVLELVYAGVFVVQNVPESSLEPFLMIECPRLLFPFARRIVADTTRDGGFPPLLLDPVDFVGLYRRRQQQGEAERGGQPVPNPIVSDGAG